VLEMLTLLARATSDIQVTVLTCDNAQRLFLRDLRNTGVTVFQAPCKLVMGYPDIAIEKLSASIDSFDIAWMSDAEALVAPRIKKIRKDIPIIVSVHSFGLVCPSRDALYALQDTCTRGCSVRRIIQCKQCYNACSAEYGLLSKSRERFYHLIDYATGPIDLLRWPMRERVVQSMDGFVAVSEFARNLLLIHLPELRNIPFDVVPNPVMVPEIAAENEDRKDDLDIVYASGGTLTKGPHICLYAGRRLIDEGVREFKLTMLGVKGNRWIEKYVRELGLQKHVELFPRVEREEGCRFMARSSLVLMPSLAPEAFGRIPVEANKLGTPAIVSDRGALPDAIVDRITGFVAEPSEEVFAQAVARALTERWDRELIVRTARTRFDPERIVNDFIRFLHRFG